jgi:glyoxylase-like metal-dependent hydrolase (beta-lactamase superfamily II)
MNNDERASRVTTTKTMSFPATSDYRVNQALRRILSIIGRQRFLKGRIKVLRDFALTGIIAIMRQQRLGKRVWLIMAAQLAGTSLRGGTPQEQLEHSPPNLVAQTIEARTLITRAVQFVGGIEAITNIKRLRYATDGEGFNGLQGYDPANLEKTVTTGPIRLLAEMDYEKMRYRRTSSQTLPGAIPLDSVTYYNGGHTSTVFPLTRKIVQADGPPAQIVDSTARYIPAFIAGRAMQNLSTATLVGQVSEQGVRSALVDFSWDASTRVRLHLDKHTGRILSLETFQFDPLLGDDTTLYTFAGDQKVQGLDFPREITVIKRGRPYIRVRVVQIEVNPAFEDALFHAPSDCEALPQELTTDRVADNVYEVTGISQGTFRVIFFDLGDSVAVLDAPESRSTSAKVVEEIRKTLGSKPIKYVIVSHFHDDHLAGIGYYVDNGVQIVTARAAAPAIARYAKTSSVLKNDLPPRGVPPKFLFVDGEKEHVTGGTGKDMIVYRLDNCPHVKDMLVVYDPGARLIVQADIYVDLAPYSQASAAFETWLRGRGLAVEYVAGTHKSKVAFDGIERPAKGT